MPDLKKALRDFVATSNSGTYTDEKVLLSKFPELKGYDVQTLRDFVATSNSGTYKTEEELFSKFPEFNQGTTPVKKKFALDSSSGVGSSELPKSNKQKTEEFENAVKSFSEKQKATPKDAAGQPIVKPQIDKALKATFTKINNKVGSDKRISQTLGKINSNLIGKEEEEVVSQLSKDQTLKDLGFTFEESGALGDYVTVTAPDGKTTTEISLDNFLGSKSAKQALALQKFIKDNTSKEKRIELDKIVLKEEFENKQLQDKKKKLGDIFDKQLGTKPKVEDSAYLKERLASIDTDLINETEENVVAEMEYQFGDLGFKFEKTGVLGDYMKVIAPNGKETEISLDNFLDSKSTKQADLLKGFIKTNTPAKGLFVLERTQKEEDKKFNSQKQVDESIKSFSKDLNDLNSRQKQFLAKKAQLDKQIKENGLTQELQNQGIALNEEMKTLLDEEENIKYKQRKLDAAVGKYTIMESKKGGWLGGIVNEFLEGSSSITASLSKNITDLSIEVMDAESGIDPKELKSVSVDISKKLGITPPKESQTLEQWKETLTEDQLDDWEDEVDDYKKKSLKDVYSAIRIGNREVFGDRETTTAWTDLKKEGFWGGAILGLSRSLPAMIGGSGPAGWAQRTAQMYSQISDGLDVEMQNNPEFANISENEKLAITLPIGITSAVLEAYGLRNIKASKGVIANLTMRALGKTGTATSAKTFRELVENEVESALARGLLTITAAGVAEFETGAAQEATTILFKDVYNEIKGKEMFDTPDSIEDLLENVLVSGAQEAVGGFVLGVPTSVSAAYSKKGFLKMDDNTFETFANMANDENMQSAYVTSLKNQITQGIITMSEAKTQLNDYRNAAGLYRQLPEGLNTQQKKEAMNLLKEKRDLQNYVEGKDNALVVKQKERITEIDNSLTKLSETDAIQEQSTTEVPVQSETITSEEVAEGISQPKPEITTEQDTQEEVVKPEVITEQTEPQTIIEEPTITIADAINDRTGAYLYDGKKGVITTIGQTVVLETDKEIIDLGNIDELNESTLNDFGIIKAEEVILNDDNSINIGEKKYVNNYSNPEAAISQDKNGNYSVTLDTDNGQKRTFRGQQAEQIVYQMKLKNFEKNGTEQDIDTAIELADEAIRIEEEIGQPSVEREGKTTRKAKRKQRTLKTIKEPLTKSEREVLQPEVTEQVAEPQVVSEQVETTPIITNKSATNNFDDINRSENKSLGGETIEFSFEGSDGNIYKAEMVADDAIGYVGLTRVDGNGGSKFINEAEAYYKKLKQQKVDSNETDTETKDRLRKGIIKEIERELERNKRSYEQRDEDISVEYFESLSRALTRKEIDAEIATIPQKKAKLKEQYESKKAELEKKLEKVKDKKKTIEPEVKDPISELEKKLSDEKQKRYNAQQSYFKAKDNGKNGLKEFREFTKGQEKVKEIEKQLKELKNKKESKPQVVSKQSETAPVVEEVVEAPVPVVEEVNELLELDTKDQTSLQRVLDYLDNLDSSLDLNPNELNDVTRVMAISTAKAVVKTLKALVKAGITLQEAIKAASEIHNVADEDILKAFEVIEQGGRQKSAPSPLKSDIYAGEGRIISIVKDITKITMREKDLLVKQIKDRAKGAREAITAWKTTSKELAKEIKELTDSGKITTKQAANAITKFSKVNVFSQKSINDFVDYMSKVFADADYADDLKNAKTLRKKLKKLSKNETKNGQLTSLASEFVKIDPSMVDNISEYNDTADKLKKAIEGSNTRGGILNVADTVDINEVSTYVADVIEQQEEKIQQEKIDEIQNLFGVDASEFSAEEIEELLKTDSKIDDNKAKIIKAAIKKAFNTYASIIKEQVKTGIDIFTDDEVAYTDAQKKLIKRFMDMDTDNMDAKESLAAIDSLVNFLVNKSTARMETVVEQYEKGQNAKKIFDKGITSVPLKKYFSPKLGRFLAEQTSNIGLLLEKAFVGFNRSKVVKEAMGYFELVNGSARAISKSNRIVSDYVKEFYDKKANGEKFNTLYNSVERGMTAFMIRNIIGSESKMQAEFQRRKDLLKESTDYLLKYGNEQEKQQGIEYQKAYDKILKDSNNADEVMSKVDNKNLEAVNWWINEWSSKFDSLSDLALNVYNTVLARGVNYTPDKYKKFNFDESIEDLSNNESAFVVNTDGFTYKKESSGLMKSNFPTKLPNNEKTKTPKSYIDLSFDKVNSNAMYDALVDLETAAPIRGIEAFMNSPYFREIIKSQEDAKLIRGRINNYIRNTRNKNPFSSDELSSAFKALNKMATLGASQALAGPTQPLKQVIPVIFNTLMNSKGRLDVGATYDSKFMKWFKDSGFATGNRGIESLAEIDSIDNLMQQAAESKGAKIWRFIEKANEKQLKILLSNPDKWIAISSWKTYYEQSLRKQGKRPDYTNPEINEEASNYAEEMVSRQQNVSDKNMAGNLFTSKDTATNAIVKAFMPFASFRMNQSTRIGSDLRVLQYWNVSTKEDKILAARSLAGFGVESLMFKAIATAFALVFDEIASSIMGVNDEDEKEKRKDAIYKGQATGIITDIFSPLPVFDKPIQGGVSYSLSSIQEAMDIPEKDMVALYGMGKEDFAKGLGMFGITISRASEIYELVSLATTGKYKDNFGKEKEIDESKREELVKLVGPMIVSSATGFAAPETSSVVRNSVRYAKKKAKPINKKLLKEKAPDKYERMYGEGSAIYEIEQRKKEMKKRIEERKANR